ncbi:MAG: division/cell wall cluster transcriptional repressor MraZ [Alphaproteobacteria bacterium]|nr:division/cell wall cluster transcriptional repressor MraZ [Alphaproteobacteria bacterium]
MALFLSTYTNKVDKKGRVSVPASFRAVIASQNFSGIVAYDSFINACVEACAMDRIEKLHNQIEALDPFSEEHDAFAATILGGSQQLPFDSEGRVMLPKAMMDAAGIIDQAVFVGKGQTFEIWEPKAFEEHMAVARKLAQERRSQLRATPKKSGDEA